MRRLLKRAIQLLLLLAGAFVLWLGWYASTHGFSKRWRLVVTQEFRKRGIQVYMRRITLDPFHGLVAREVRVLDPRQPGKQLAIIDRIALDINYANLLQHESFLNAVDLRNAYLALPLDPSDQKSERLIVAQLNARLLFPPHQIYVSEANARILGIEISARGRLLNPEAFKSSGTQTNAQITSRENMIKLLRDRLRTVRFEGGAPRLDVEFSGDLARPNSLFAEATLWGQKIRSVNYRLENIFASLQLREGICNLTRCIISDSRGVLDATGSYELASKKAALQLRSTLDLQALTHSIRGAPRALDEFVFYDPPSIEISGEGALGDKPRIKLLGRAALKKFAVKSAVFDGASANFSYDGSRWYLRDVSLRNRTGAVSLNAIQLPGDFRAKLQSSINPRSLLPLVSGKAAEMLGEYEFLQSPHITLAMHGPSPDFDRCEADGELKLGHTRLRGVALNSANATLRIANKAVSYENFKVQRDEGIGTGTFTYDFGVHEVHLNNVKTSLSPGDVATWIDPGLVHDVAPYRFHGPPNLSINGHVGNDNTNLEVLVDAPNGMDYTFIKKNLSFPKISGRLLFTEGRLQISDLAGSLYSGGLKGDAEISLKRDAPGYTAKLEAENVDFASLTKLYFNYDNSHGLLNGTFDFRGRNDDAKTLQGTGEIAVLDGNVFAIPVLGPFSSILNSIVPNMGYDIAHKASCTFSVRDGVITTNDFVVKGNGFDMIGGGRLFFLDDKIDFTIRLNAQGVPGVLLFPVSKLFEYVSDGSLSKPQWKPKRLPGL